jgi:hypothetical protein
MSKFTIRIFTNSDEALKMFEDPRTIPRDWPEACKIYDCIMDEVATLLEEEPNVFLEFRCEPFELCVFVVAERSVTSILGGCHETVYTLMSWPTTILKERELRATGPPFRSLSIWIRWKQLG